MATSGDQKLAVDSSSAHPSLSRTRLSPWRDGRHLGLFTFEGVAAALNIRRHLLDRANTRTAANAESRWLFPGGMPGAHLDPGALAGALRAGGMPVRATRNTTWQQLVRQAPPQILADALGISPTTAMRHAEHAGSDWARYAAASDHARHPRLTNPTRSHPQDPPRIQAVDGSPDK